MGLCHLWFEWLNSIQLESICIESISDYKSLPKSTMTSSHANHSGTDSWVTTLEPWRLERVLSDCHFRNFLDPCTRTAMSHKLFSLNRIRLTTTVVKSQETRKKKRDYHLTNLCFFFTCVLKEIVDRSPIQHNAFSCYINFERINSVPNVWK